MIDLKPIEEMCARGNPLIAMVGGVPRVTGGQVTVSEVLARLYVHGSVRAAVKYYDDLTEEQVKEAISYAHRFFELAYPPARDDRG